MQKRYKFRLWGRVFILPKWTKAAAICVCAAIALIAGLLIRNTQKNKELPVILNASATTESKSPIPTVTPIQSIHVYVVGQVAKPGVYKLPKDSLVSVAIEAAGGFTTTADREAVNLVEVLSENTMVKIPTYGDKSSGGGLITQSGESGSSSKNKKVNINTAGSDELCTLSGIGESTAKKIVNYRTEHGPFNTVEDIMNVPGIKEAKFASFKDDICVS